MATQDEDEGSPTNADRAAWADVAVEAFNMAKEEYGGEDESDAPHLITDILHRLARDGRNAREELDRAWMNYEMEGGK